MGEPRPRTIRRKVANRACEEKDIDMGDAHLNGSWSPPDTSRPPRSPNRVFCVCVACKATGVCPSANLKDAAEGEFEKIDGRLYCPACAEQRR